MKNITYILLSFLLVFAGCRKVDKVETYQVEVGETTVTAGSDNVGIEAAYTYDYTLKSARLQYSDDSELENAVSLAAQFAGGVLKATATGLKPATAYFYRFELDNGITKMWTDTGTFRTLDEPIVTELVVTTAEVSCVTDTVAVCGGNVVCEGDTTVIARGVCYGLSENPSLDDCTGKTVDGGGLGTFTSVMTGLKRETRYYVKAYATNDDTTCYGEQKVFTTLGQIVYSLPTVITNTVDETTVGQYSAMLSGVVTDDGNKPVTGCGFWYSTGHDTLGGITKPAAYSTGGFSLNVSDGIEPGTTYYARAYAENELGRRLGNEVIFTTLSIPPTPDPQVFTLSSADVTTNSATIKGRVYYDGTENPIKKGFLYGTDINDLDKDADCTSQSDPFEAALTGLTPDTKYYYMAYATYTGYPQTFYGGIENFTTLIEITEPTIHTVGPSNITTTTANSGGYGITDGNSPIVKKGVCWATFENPTLGNCLGYTEDGAGTADFTSEVTGLEPDEDYYVRAYAVNQAGKTGYGEAKGFVTMQEETGNYFCITALDAGTTTVSMAKEGNAPTVYLEYKKNNGTWTAFTVGSTNISLSQNDKVFFKAPDGQPNNKFATGYGDCNHFVIGGGNVDVSGNIMYLLDPTGNKITLTSANSYAFAHLFNGCDKLASAGQLLMPATTLAEMCYYGMFDGCTSLTTAPDLPATTLAEGCYQWMFSGCTSLTAAPNLPATTLAEMCYGDMFEGCTSLTTAPDLPATTLAEYCYGGMFWGCTSLTTAPNLPATTLAQSCYYEMFESCASLTTAPDLPATTLAGWCYYMMFKGCTSLTTAPDLPATTLAESCYSVMFSGCTSLTTAPDLPATTLAYRCYDGMFYDCTSLTTAPNLPATTLAVQCYESMFESCTSLTTAPDLPATTLADYCYMGMFEGCTSLHYIRMLATENLNATEALYEWVSGVPSTGNFYKKAGANLPNGSSGIPSGWTVHNE